MVDSISIALSGLNAASKRLSASASNVANLQTVGSLENGQQAPYTPLTTQQTAITVDGQSAGVQTDIVQRKVDPFVPSYDPDSPFANAEGLIGVPNVDLAEEAVNINLAEIQYKANIATIKATQELDNELLSIFDEKV